MASFRQRATRALVATNSRLVRWHGAWRRHVWPAGDTVFISAMPKSGSTYLTRLLADATGYLQYFLGTHHRNEQDLYLPRLVDAAPLNTVSHQHTRPTCENVRLMRLYGIRPVILTRNIADSLVSLRDMLVHNAPDSPVLRVPADFADWPADRQFDMMIDLAGPWYARFVGDWAAEDRLETLWLRYEDMIDAPTAQVRRVADFYGLDLPDRQIEAAVRALGRGDPRATRLNRGVRGRGARLMTSDQLTRLSGLFDYYPMVDRGLIGV
ncbi:MAG: sulfotransferase domain-containing protein [Alphaproteobacteria bacterium]|nr:sulfotransferase domain-containing protein [Alphaproteobacteria bacterium]MCB9930025.1 sulfotransferase domain-containing protein [Alphaproteobacteria bacterium]